MEIGPVVSEIQPRTNRQTDKQTDRQTDKPTETYIDRAAVYKNIVGNVILSLFPLFLHFSANA